MTPSVELIPLVVALLVSFFGLLLAGHAFASRHEPGMSTFAFGPLGIATMTVAALLHGIGLPPLLTGTVAYAGASTSFLGFALEVWRDARLRRRAVVATTVVVVLSTAFFGALALQWVSLSPWRFVGRAFAFTPVVFVLVGHFSMRRVGLEPERRTSRRLTLAIVVAFLAGLLASVPSMFSATGSISDPLMWVALASLTASWVAVAEGRVTVRLFATRALTWLVLFLGLVAVLAAAARQLDFSFDLRTVLTGVFATLLVGVGFVVVSEAASRRVDALFAPQRSALELELGRARETVQAMQSKWSHLERLALTGELAAMVAHEIKNPLAALRGWAETLTELAPKLADADRSRLEKALGIIKDESDRIDARVQSLLQVARPPVAAPAAPFLVNQVVSEAVALVEAQSKTVVVALELTAEGRSVRGSADGLRTALVNLLRNAVEAQSSGQVRVQVSSLSAAVRVVVVDQGSGLSADQLAQPIVAFRSTKPGGTGLGLVIAEAGVRACSGALSFSANTPHGTCATITLPVES